ncbi:radical SAM protein [Gluconacetobacter azotocaptans]|uniref:radical SAM protein n=1 Tax=Gluconacetobacter azotocaptans TaxID=142834 RepID=UPI002156D3AC|nr:DNA repair photolyase [Gluconacetobacter azotocaptans DSM 13594]
MRRPSYQPRPIALGTNTDPYQPVERTQGLTRAILDVLERFSHPVTIVTKSAGVLRDLDILTALAARNLVRVSLSVTTLDPELARRMEPRAATPARRLEAIRTLSAAGVPTTVMAAPMIPALNDSEMEAILAASAQAGARGAAYVLLRLPQEVAPLFEDWIVRHYPDRAARVLARIRETRNGRIADLWFAHNTLTIMLGATDRIAVTDNLPSARPWMYRVAPALSRAVAVTGPVPNTETLLGAGVDVAFISAGSPAELPLRRSGFPVVDAGFTDAPSMIRALDLTADVLGDARAHDMARPRSRSRAYR